MHVHRISNGRFGTAPREFSPHRSRSRSSCPRRRSLHPDRTPDDHHRRRASRQPPPAGSRPRQGARPGRPLPEPASATRPGHARWRRGQRRPDGDPVPAAPRVHLGLRAEHQPAPLQLQPLRLPHLRAPTIPGLAAHLRHPTRSSSRLHRRRPRRDPPPEPGRAPGDLPAPGRHHQPRAGRIRGAAVLLFSRGERVRGPCPSSGAGPTAFSSTATPSASEGAHSRTWAFAACSRATSCPATTPPVMRRSHVVPLCPPGPECAPGRGRARRGSTRDAASETLAHLGGNRRSRLLLPPPGSGTAPIGSTEAGTRGLGPRSEPVSPAPAKPPSCSPPTMPGNAFFASSSPPCAPSHPWSASPPADS